MNADLGFHDLLLRMIQATVLVHRSDAWTKHRLPHYYYVVLTASVLNVWFPARSNP
jgi:hypothetical protein